jgi:allantoinase
VTDLVLRARRVVTREGTRPAAIWIADGRITAVKPYADVRPATPLAEAGNAVVMPGLVDTHVHVNEPGRTEWEGFASATRAAAAGGVTTLLDMPLNCVPPTTTVAALQDKRDAAREKIAVDVGFVGGVVPGNAGELRALHAAGVLAFKCFLLASGTEEFASVTDSDLRAALPVLAELGAVLMVHAELPGLIAHPVGDRRRYATWQAARPVEAEHRAVAWLSALAEEYGARIHVLHIASAGSIPILAAARSRGASVTGETCPHYLTFAAEEIPDRATEYKCAPPIGGSANREQLWRALAEGALDAIVSDHSPCPPELKCRESGDFLSAWGGISSLQLGLPAVWTGARARGFSLERLSEWMSAAPARLAGLDRSKGTIAAGMDADLVVWRPEEEFVVEAIDLKHRHRLTPYLGRRLAGVVETTYLRGVPAFRRGAPDSPPTGRLLGRPGTEGDR